MEITFPTFSERTAQVYQTVTFSPWESSEICVCNCVHVARYVAQNIGTELQVTHM